MSLTTKLQSQQLLRIPYTRTQNMSRPRKRPILEVDMDPSDAESLTPRNIKRKTEESTTSDTSYVSAAAAIFSESDSDSKGTAQTDIDSDSELSTSSEEPSSESDDSSDEEGSGDEEITDVRVGTKPDIKIDGLVGAGGGLLERVKKFLPKLEEANGELAKAKENGTLGKRCLEIEGDGEGQYIEMDLGLGVLEERQHGVSHKNDTDSDSDMASSTDDANEEIHATEKDIIGSLMGQKKRRKGVNIEEVQDG